MTRRYSYRFDHSTSVSRRFRWPACITISIWRMAMYDPVDMKSNTRARTLAIASPLRGMPRAFSMISIFPKQTGQRREDK